MMQSFHITSIKDARVVEARELTSVAGRARFQKTQLEGEESIQWALEALQITPEGERAIAQLWGVVEQSENEVLAGFSAQEKEQLVSYLKRIQANCATITRS